MSPTIPSHGMILTGMQSSSGKTAITCMLLSVLQERGLDPQAFKVGPDFIDPGYHSHYTKRPCINLDAWMMGKSRILREVERYVAGTVGVVEGVMGLFDGASPSSDEGSTMELAHWLGWPVVLIVPCRKAGRSIAAAIQGFMEKAGNGRISGVILNQVGGESHAQYLREALSYLKLPILGVVSHHEILQWPERHLGLHPQAEMQLPESKELARLAEEVLDIPAILSLLTPAPLLQKPATPFQDPSPGPSLKGRGNHFSFRKRIGLARDEAFHFYYHANLEFLKSCGVELIEFSPLSDSTLPAGIEGMIFGGGFPEVFAEQIAENRTMRTAIAQAINDGMPCYAECGGLMILSRELISREKERYPMAGVLPGAVEMTERLNNFGYCFCKPLAPDPPNDSAGNQSWRGHEFHYSRWLAEAEAANLWQVTKKYRNVTRKEGFRYQQLHASYVHLYFPTASAVLEEIFGLTPPS